MNNITAKNEIINIGKKLIDKKFTWGNAGNISIRVDEETFLITASGTILNELTDNDIVECKLTEKGYEYKGETKPSKEAIIHSLVYKKRKDINFVIHVSPFYATFISILGLEIPNNLFVENMYYLERIKKVPYKHPGSIELASEIERYVPQTNIILLENHGILCYDTNSRETMIAIEILEETCRMVILSKSMGTDIVGLREEIVKDFLENTGYKKRRKWEDGR